MPKRTSMPSLRFYADTYIITTCYLNDTSVTFIFCYVSMMGSQHAQLFKNSFM